MPGVPPPPPQRPIWESGEEPPGQVDVTLGGAGPDGQEDAGARQGGDELRGAGERGGRMPAAVAPTARVWWGR